MAEEEREGHGTHEPGARLLHLAREDEALVLVADGEVDARRRLGDDVAHRALDKLAERLGGELAHGDRATRRLPARVDEDEEVRRDLTARHALRQRKRQAVEGERELGGEVHRPTSAHGPMRGPVESCGELDRAPDARRLGLELDLNASGDVPRAVGVPQPEHLAEARVLERDAQRVGLGAHGQNQPVRARVVPEDDGRERVVGCAAEPLRHARHARWRGNVEKACVRRVEARGLVVARDRHGERVVVDAARLRQVDGDAAKRAGDDLDRRVARGNGHVARPEAVRPLARGDKVAAAPLPPLDGVDALGQADLDDDGVLAF